MAGVDQCTTLLLNPDLSACFGIVSKQNVRSGVLGLCSANHPPSRSCTCRTRCHFRPFQIPDCGVGQLQPLTPLGVNPNSGRSSRVVSNEKFLVRSRGSNSDTALGEGGYTRPGWQEGPVADGESKPSLARQMGGFSSSRPRTSGDRPNVGMVSKADGRSVQTPDVFTEKRGAWQSGAHQLQQSANVTAASPSAGYLRRPARSNSTPRNITSRFEPQTFTRRIEGQKAAEPKSFPAERVGPKPQNPARRRASAQPGSMQPPAVKGAGDPPTRIRRKWEELPPEPLKPVVSEESKLALSEVKKALAAAGGVGVPKKWEEGASGLPPPRAAEPLTPPPQIQKTRLSAIITGDRSSLGGSQSEGEDSDGALKRGGTSGGISGGGRRFFMEPLEPVDVDPAVRERQIAEWLTRNGLSKRRGSREESTAGQETLVPDGLGNGLGKKLSPELRQGSTGQDAAGSRLSAREESRQAAPRQGNPSRKQLAAGFDKWAEENEQRVEPELRRRVKEHQRRGSVTNNAAELAPDVLNENGIGEWEANESEGAMWRDNGRGRGGSEGGWESDSWRGLALEAEEDATTSGQSGERPERHMDSR
jgi:hypothetical protein